MKKLIVVFAAVLMAFSSLAAAEVSSDRYTTKDYNLKDFTGIVASGIFEIEMVKSNTWKVSVTCPEVLEEYIIVRVSNGKLSLSMKQVPLKISRNFKNWNVTAKVAMPVFTSLTLSGAAKFECADAFDIRDKDFRLDISGAAKAHGLDIVARDLVMEMSGATSATLRGDFENAKIEMGGAAKCEFEISADILNQEISGAAKAYHTGEFARIDAEASGAGVFSFKGAADVMEIEVSGAAKAEMARATVNEVKASVSGASFCEVNAVKSLQVEASGASSLRYVDNDNLKLDIRSIGRGSSVTRMK